MSEEYAEAPAKPRRHEDNEPRRRRREYDGDYDIRWRDGNLADRGSRLVAFLIDEFLAGLCQIPGQIMIFTALTVDVWSVIGNPIAMMEVLFKGFVVAELGLLAYWGAMAFMISRSGQTIGKKAMGIRIVRYDDLKLPGVVHGWVLRWLPIHAINFIPYFGGILGLIDVLFIFGEEKRCLHDLIANTKVVMVVPFSSEEDER